jgi:hypothetical protein
MTRTITQVVSQPQPQPRPTGWSRIGWSRIGWSKIAVIATMLAFCSTLLPLASAQCGGALLSPRLQTIPTIPGMLTAPAAVAPNPSASTPKTSVSIVGLWKINFLAGGAIVDVAFDAWHSDGTELLNDYTDPIEGNVCLGVWQQTGSSTYKLKHPSWYFDTNGNLLGTVIIHESVTLSADGNSFGGPAIEDVYDTSGNLLEVLTAQVEATRITAN